MRIALVFMTITRNSDGFSILVHANQHNRHSAVLMAACELFIENHHPSRQELLHFEELCLRLLPKISLQIKADFAEQIATCPLLPRAVALSLAKDDISVAAPLLSHYGQFTDEDLLVILANGNVVHALAIAARPKLSEKVTIALSRYKIPQFGTLDLLETEVLRAESMMPTAADMTPLNLEWIEEAEKPLAMIDTAARPIHQALSADAQPFPLHNLERFMAQEHAHVLTQLDTIEQRLRQRGGDPLSLLKTAYMRAEQAVTFVKLARGGDKSGFARLMARECNLSPDACDTILADPNGFALAICLKSLSLPPETANEAFILLNPILGRDVEQVYLLEWFYGAISAGGAREIVQQWRAPRDSITPEKRTTYATVTAGQSLSDARPERSQERNPGSTARTVRSRHAI